MTEQDDAITIRIAPAPGGGYTTAPGLDGVPGDTMAEALTTALDELKKMGSLSDDALRVKVHERTRVSGPELIALLQALPAPERLDLGGCNLNGIDLRPDALDRIHCPETLRVEETRGINLQRAQLQDAWLSGAQLQGAWLGDAQLQGAWLSGAQLQGAWLGGAQLQGADLRGAGCRDVDFRRAASLDRVRWHNARLEKTWLYRHCIEPVGDEIAALMSKDPDGYRQAMEAYLVLKTNFQSLGNYEDASWAYVKEQQMEKMAMYWEWRSSGWAPWRHWRSFLRWLRNWAYELLTGYGERPQNPVLAGGLIMSAFALGYWLTGALGGLVDALVYSLATFATFNLGRPALNPEGRGVELASSIEALLGISVLALVIYTLGNRMSRS